MLDPVHVNKTYCQQDPLYHKPSDAWHICNEWIATNMLPQHVRILKVLSEGVKQRFFFFFFFFFF